MARGCLSKVITAFVAIALIAGAASKASAGSAARAYGWTGFYLGGNIGYGWGASHTDMVGSETANTFVGFVPGARGFSSTFDFADTNKARLTGVIGGGQLGFNYQVGPQWVLGVEADIQGSGQRGSNTLVGPFSASVCTTAVNPPPACLDSGILNGAAITPYEGKITWFGTVRGRAGILAANTLIYATGGLAYGGLSLAGNSNFSGTITTMGGPFSVPGTATAFNLSKTGVGFAVGGGLEGKLSAWLSPNWSWKLEYLYLDLGSIDATIPFSFPVNGSTNPGSMMMHAHFTDNVVRVGMNYKFN